MANNKSIMIVEDNVGISSSLQQFFESEGYAVQVAENGQKALDLLNKNSTLPGIIFLDVAMPVMDGPAFILELSENHPQMFSAVPIFVMTAGGGIHQNMVKATGVVKKPFDLDELCKVTEKYCKILD